MNHTDIINEFRHTIEDEASRIEETAQRNAHACIRAICRCFEFGEYDWKNSPEGFDNWVERNFTSMPRVRGELLKQYRSIKDADEYFQQIYYGINTLSDTHPAATGCDGSERLM